MDADAVQENRPEQLDFKQRIFARIEQATRLDTLLLSSTSGIRATQIAEAMKQPGRLVVGHPFNPPHLIPLVEDLGSPRLDQPTVELLGEQARGDEPVAVLAAERDQAQIKLMQALGETPPDDPKRVWRYQPGVAPG